MTWTYGGDPSANNRDEVRFLCGDTDTSDQLATDEEIAYAITEGGSNIIAAAIICEALAAQFARDVDNKIGSPATSESSSQRAKAFKAQAKDLRSRVGAIIPTLSFGGQSIDEKQAYYDDSDAVQPSFTRGMTDNPNGPHDIGTGVSDLYDEEDA